MCPPSPCSCPCPVRASMCCFPCTHFARFAQVGDGAIAAFAVAARVAWHAAHQELRELCSQVHPRDLGCPALCPQPPLNDSDVAEPRVVCRQADSICERDGRWSGCISMQVRTPLTNLLTTYLLTYTYPLTTTLLNTDLSCVHLARAEKARALLGPARLAWPAACDPGPVPGPGPVTLLCRARPLHTCARASASK